MYNLLNISYDIKDPPHARKHIGLTSEVALHSNNYCLGCARLTFKVERGGNFKKMKDYFCNFFKIKVLGKKMRGKFKNLTSLFIRGYNSPNFPHSYDIIYITYNVNSLKILTKSNNMVYYKCSGKADFLFAITAPTGVKT